MATSKALRAAPPRILDNYVASIQMLNGSAPEAIPDSAFMSGDFLSDGSSTMPTSFSANRPIGFTFTANNVRYSNFSVSGYGWLFLQQPGISSPEVVQVLTSDVLPYENTIIRSSFLNNHILLAPWFDTAENIPATPDVLDAGEYATKITPQILSDIKAGVDTRNWPYDAIDRGARFKNFYDPQNGNALAIRWTVSQVNFLDKLKFEAVVFENGKIQFKYWPLQRFELSDTTATASAATVGIFWNGTGVADKFRDLSPLLGYRVGNTQLGGAAFNSAYTETSKPYSNLVGTANWPSGGAIITFSPPVNAAKFLPKKLISAIGSSREIVRSPGMFDDRRTILYTSSPIVHMPSTLPDRLQGNTGDVNVSLRQLLFVSGSESGSLFISSGGRVSKTAIDSQVAQIDALARATAASDMSFNESQKNYESTYSSSSFYSSGSPVELFGDGFTSPLKSKTQFFFSLPVTKPVVMPSLTSSLYYYNSERKSWDSIGPTIQPFPVISVPDDSAGDKATVEYQMDAQPVYRIVETSKAFDAVGRRVISGSNLTAFRDLSATSGRTYQSADSIGSILNASNTGSIESLSFLNHLFFDEAKSAHFLEYSKSIYDSFDFAPSQQQKIGLQITEPFLLEKLSIKLPLYINGAWFDDITTCTRPFMNSTAAIYARGRFKGAIDFGGPGITVALFCDRSGAGIRYMDLIASGTITHTNDMTASVVLKKDPGMEFYSMRPTGFLSFSNPSTVISGTNNIFDGIVQLDMASAIAGGLTIARLDRSHQTASAGGSLVPGKVSSNRSQAIFLLTSEKLFATGEKSISTGDKYADRGGGALEITNYNNRSPRVYVQNVSPLSRGSTGVEFNGNSILGGNIASFNLENQVKNPLYVAPSGSLPASFKAAIDTSNFAFEAITVYSTIDVQQSPYLLLPGDRLTISISKTRSTHYTMAGSAAATSGQFQLYNSYTLTGSHGTVMLNTGSIDLTLYGSYVREGVEYNP